MNDDGAVVGCFLRVDVGLAGEHSPDAYDAISERLQDLLQEAILGEAEGQTAIELRGMTCLALGPLTRAESIEETLRWEDSFAPVGEWLAYVQDADA